MPKVAAILQRDIVRHELLVAGAASAGKAAAQRQAVWEWPADRKCSFCREEVRASHNEFILGSCAPDCVQFFCL
jgi:hypothetical protein